MPIEAIARPVESKQGRRRLVPQIGISRICGAELKCLQPDPVPSGFRILLRVSELNQRRQQTMGRALVPIPLLRERRLE
jgi:hypothetical protein